MIRAFIILALTCGMGLAQQLEPRAYSISPTGVNIAIFGYGYATGDLNFDPSLPIDNGSARINGATAAYYRSLNAFGRSANVAVSLPYSWGHIQGDYFGVFTPIYRSGWTDTFARFAVNLRGAPAMRLKEFAGYRQKTNIGLSTIVSAPTGQYDPNKLINIGSNRWAFKPELGISHRIAETRWLIDAYVGVWLYTPNHNFQGKTRTQNPIMSSQFHLSYDVQPRLWVAFDANFFRGGQTSIGGLLRNDLQANSRVGATIAIPLTRRQGFKFSYAAGAYTTVGGAFQTFTWGYQYLWGGGL